MYKKYLSTYSDSIIYSYFHKAVKGKNQVSPHYLNNPIILNNLVNDLTQRTIAFRDALINPLDQIIRNNIKYYCSNTDIRNAQARGPQAHLDVQLFRDAALCGNNIEATNLSGFELANMDTFYTRNVEQVVYPASYFNASPKSFFQALESITAIMFSGVTGHRKFI